MRLPISLALVLLLSACVNGYEENYRPNPEIAYDGSSFLPPSGRPRLIKGTTADQDDERMGRDGYVLIGSATFSAGERVWSALDERAVEQARNVGADAVVVYQSYRNTRHGAVTHSTHSVTSTRTTEHGAIHPGHRGLGHSKHGDGVIFGRSSTTSGGTTAVVPYSQDVYDYGATFWRRLKRGGLGANFRNLSNEERRLSGSNKGVAVSAVRRGSVAFEEDILVGDILRQVGPTRIVDVPSAVSALRPYIGRTVTIVLWRDGKTVEKTIRIPELRS